jgi:molecular chaperone DnaK
LKQDAEAIWDKLPPARNYSASPFHGRPAVTKDAYTIAGLVPADRQRTNRHAFLSYGLTSKNIEQKSWSLTLGGGNFDVSIRNSETEFLKSTLPPANNHLEETTFDDCIVQWLVEVFRTQEGSDLSTDKYFATPFTEKQRKKLLK